MAVTSLTGDLIMVNSALGKLLGCPGEALVGRRLEDLSNPEDAAAFIRGREEVAARGLTRLDVKGTLRRADGTAVFVALHCPANPSDPSHLSAEEQTPVWWSTSRT